MATPRPGVVTQLFDIGGAVARRAGAMLEVLADFDSLEDVIVTESLPEVQRAPVIDLVTLADAKLSAPVRPPRVFQVGLNYHSHVVELCLSQPHSPIFAVSATADALSSPDEPITIPTDNPHEIDYEAEIAVVIGATASNVTARDAWKVVAGLTACNDVTARDLQRAGLRTGDVTAGKMLPGFTPLGPGLLITDEMRARLLSIRLTVNGEVRQAADASQMIFSIPELIEAISRAHVLQPGDVIMTGSPAGVGSSTGTYLASGDVVTITLGPLPPLRNVVYGHPIPA